MDDLTFRWRRFPRVQLLKSLVEPGVPAHNIRAGLPA